jgi:molecular chaperone DnaJ
MGAAFRSSAAPAKIRSMSAVKADYYEVLGVERDADEETIRRAFHASARDCHPDVSDSPEAEQRFRELAEAYGVLSKPTSRLLYDRYGYRGRGNSGFDEALWEARVPARRGENVHTELVFRSFEAAEGGFRLVHFAAARTCPTCEGRGTEEQPDPDCSECGGTGRRRQVSHSEVGRLLQIQACPVCTPDPCSECGGAGAVMAQRRLRLLIPAGLKDGDQLRVGGEGNAAEPGAIPGDLLLDVRVLPEPRDPRLVRYLALALFVAALVVLFVYLH